MEEKDKNKNSFKDKWQDPSKKERIIFSVLVFFGIAILFLGILQIYSNIRAPFIRQALESQLNIATKLSQPQASFNTGVSDQLSPEELKLTDTDKDGLNDFDELNVYNTSPYLEDTDSDGILDKKEIEDQTDPNCPVGKQCDGLSTSSNSNTNQPIDAGEQFNFLPPTGDAQSEALGGLLNGDISTAEIRKILLNAGISQQVLDQFDDETLREVYMETLKNINP